MLTFRAKIKGIAVESILKNRPADFCFTFSKRRIFFSQNQIDNYRFFGNIFCTDEFYHQTEYILSIVYDKNDKKRYQIKFNKTVAILEINWFNTIKLKIIHDLLKLPNWLKKIIDKIFDKGLDAILLFATAYISYQLGISNGQLSTKLDKSTPTQQHDTTVLQKKASRSDSNNFYKDKDNLRSVSYKIDTTKK